MAEVIAPSSDSGTSDFAVLQKEIRAERSDKLVMYGIRFLFLNAMIYVRCRSLERKLLLREWVAGTGILFSEGFETAGAELQACM